MGLRFEWDKNKAVSNLRKHSVSFDEASTVFDDPLALIFDDEDHSEDGGLDQPKLITLVCSRLEQKSVIKLKLDYAVEKLACSLPTHSGSVCLWRKRCQKRKLIRV